MFVVWKCRTRKLIIIKKKHILKDDENDKKKWSFRDTTTSYVFDINTNKLLIISCEQIEHQLLRRFNYDSSAEDAWSLRMQNLPRKSKDQLDHTQKDVY